MGAEFLCHVVALDHSEERQPTWIQPDTEHVWLLRDVNFSFDSDEEALTGLRGALWRFCSAWINGDADCYRVRDDYSGADLLITRRHFLGRLALGAV